MANTQMGSSVYTWFPKRILKWSESRSVVSDSLRPHELYSAWNSPGQSSGVGSLSVLQGIFLTWGLNPGLLHCRRILYQLNHTREAKRYFTQACFSPYPPHFSVHAHHLGILLKCRFWFSNSGVRFLSLHSKYQLIQLWNLYYQRILLNSFN